jgi:hypothetical protein
MARRQPSPKPRACRSPPAPRICPSCVGRGLLGAAAERLLADPSDPLVQMAGPMAGNRTKGNGSKPAAA